MANKDPSPSTRFKGAAKVGGKPPINFKIDDPYYSTLQNLPGNRSDYIRSAVIERIELEKSLPELYVERLCQMSNRSACIAEAVQNFMQLSEDVIAKLDATGNRAKAIEQAIALLEEHDLLSELAERVRSVK